MTDCFNVKNCRCARNVVTYLPNYTASYPSSHSHRAVLWLRQFVVGLSARRSELDFRPVRVRFVVDKVSFLFKYLRFCRIDSTNAPYLFIY
jgi:hypothetical protein